MSSMNNPTAAFLYSAEQPSDAQRQRFEAFLARTYPGQALTLEWKQDAELAGGFRLEVGADIYDWSLQGRMEQLRRKLDALDAPPASFPRTAPLPEKAAGRRCTREGLCAHRTNR